MQTKCCGVMLAWCNAKLGLRAHVLYACAHTLALHACPHTHTASQLARRPVSLNPDVDGWMDAQEEQHSKSQGMALQPKERP